MPTPSVTETEYPVGPSVVVVVGTVVVVLVVVVVVVVVVLVVVVVVVVVGTVVVVVVVVVVVAGGKMFPEKIATIETAIMQTTRTINTMLEIPFLIILLHYFFDKIM
jgi:hypothetical protein